MFVFGNDPKDRFLAPFIFEISDTIFENARFDFSPQIHFLSHFVVFFFPLALCIDLASFFYWFLVAFPEAGLYKTWEKPRFFRCFCKIAIFNRRTNNHRKIVPKRSPNPFQILPKSMKNRKESRKNVIFCLFPRHPSKVQSRSTLQRALGSPAAPPQGNRGSLNRDQRFEPRPLRRVGKEYLVLVLVFVQEA